MKFSELMPKSCCRINLRDGSLIIAILYTVCSIFMFIGAITGVISTTRYTEKTRYTQKTRYTNQDYIVYDTTEDLEVNFYFIVFTTFSALLVVTCVLLIKGIFTNSYIHMFPWLCINFTHLVVSFALATGLIIKVLISETLAFFFMLVIGLPIVLGIEIYLFMVLFSFYYEMMNSRKNTVEV